MRTKILGIALAAIVLIAPAYADAVFTPGNNPQPNEENIFFHTGQMGMTIQSFTNRSDTLVQYSYSTDTLIGKGGQSDVDAADWLIKNITMTVPGHTFLDAILNPFKPGTAGDLLVKNY